MTGSFYCSSLLHLANLLNSDLKRDCKFSVNVFLKKNRAYCPVVLAQLALIVILCTAAAAIVIGVVVILCRWNKKYKDKVGTDEERTRLINDTSKSYESIIVSR